MAFSGFPADTVGFLRELATNNNRDWFTANRARYEEYFVEPAKTFVSAIAERTELGDINAEPKVNGSIFRINRDTRFSKDKTPYKDHLDLWFWHGDRKQPASAFFLRLAPDQVGVGVGAHGFDKERLARYRRAVIADPHALEKAVSEVEDRGHEVRGSHYKRIPSGFEPVGEFQQRMILHAALYCGDDEPHPAVLGSSGFVDWVVNRWVGAKPIHDWLLALG